MTSIITPDLLIIIYVLVDDWYQQSGKKYLTEKAGQKPIFTDSEGITWFWHKITFPIRPRRNTLALSTPITLTCFRN